jgi:hypothetical protein
MEVFVNWNVYKVFKNGKRAKAPVTTFAYDDKSNVYEYFEAEIKENFTEKIRDWNFTLLNEEEPQEREEEKTNKIEEDASRKQILVLARLLRDKGLTSKYRVAGGLIFAKATNWKWQWCALEAASSSFIAGLSPRFDNSVKAQKWMNQQIQNLK